MYHFLPEIVSDMGETFFEQVAREKRELFWKGRDCAKENSKKQRAELTNITKACDTKVKLFIKNFKIVHKRILTKLKNTSQYSPSFEIQTAAWHSY